MPMLFAFSCINAFGKDMYPSLPSPVMGKIVGVNWALLPWCFIDAYLILTVF